ncbi:MAG TPA: amino acid permease [Bacteroidia bacterium]|nr:amino acid permease [Bacteroidia bacterium]
MENKTGLNRTLGLFDATSIVAGSMIGSGIFIVTTFMAREIGSAGWILFLWLLTGLITITAALSYGELAAMMPKAGGQYVYIQRAYGKLISFLYGWAVFTVIQTGVIAAVAVAFSKYAAVFFPELNTVLVKTPVVTTTYAQILSVFCIVLLTYINSRGVKNGKNIQLLFTSAKLIALFALIVLGLAMGFKSGMLAQNFSNMWEANSTTVKGDGSLFTVQLAGFALVGAMGASLINPLFSSDAWNNVTFIAGEIKDPVKNIPRSLFLGTVIVTIIYILANVAYMSLLPIKGDPHATDAIGQGIMFASNDRVGTAAASIIFGNSAIYLMAALIMISTFGCNNGLILSGARLFYAMAKDGLFIKKAAEVNDKHVPSTALWFQCIWACLLCLSGQYGQLIVYSTFVSLLFYMLTIGGIFILRKKEPNTERPYKVIGYPIIPIFYILITLVITIDLIYYKPFETLGGIAIVLLGLPVYFILSLKKIESAEPTETQ